MTSAAECDTITRGERDAESDDHHATAWHHGGVLLKSLLLSIKDAMAKNLRIFFLHEFFSLDFLQRVF